MSDKTENKSEQALREICGNSFDKSEILTSNTRGFTAVIGNTKNKYFECFKYTYKGEERNIIAASSEGTYEDFLAKHKE